MHLLKCSVKDILTFDTYSYLGDLQKNIDLIPKHNMHHINYINTIWTILI